MKRPYQIVKNTSKWPTEVLTVLFDLAWDVAWGDKDPVKAHPQYNASWHSDAYRAKACVYRVRVTHNSRTARGRAWGSRCLLRLGIGERSWPMRLNYAKWKDMPEYEARNWHEMIIHIAAHEFAHLTGYSGRKQGEEMCEITAWDAIDAYRKRQEEIDGRINAVRWKTTDREQAAIRRAEAKRAQESSLEHKLAKLAAKEKVWLRKLRLALSKMKSIKRSRSSLLAWQRRQESALPIAAVKEPPCESTPSSTGSSPCENTPSSIESSS